MSGFRAEAKRASVRARSKWALTSIADLITREMGPRRSGRDLVSSIFVQNLVDIYGRRRGLAVAVHVEHNDA